ncbi:toll/interleukin-1 receptor domain-containing protein [Oleiharenicola sp. Vm1]|uniref:toll/interleukin-1 receptor domain-containing protein n=1 Tax=Oleiharenicola sp. Vm1 TaxID=3398393 RepID=UPI0039F4995C
MRKKYRKRKRKIVRRTNKELFLDALKELSGANLTLIPNAQLRDKLGWDDKRYIRIKQQLVEDEKKVISGRGRGGSVGLASAPGAKALKIFISYCHADEPLKIELAKHLTPLKHLNLVDVWHDRKIPAGGDWEHVISKNLEEADIVLLLVSIDFINSRYCYDIELERAIERHEEGGAALIPVILRNCMWQHTPFAKLQAVPKDGKPVCSFVDRDEAFTEIAGAVKATAEQILSQL